jgi:acyl carrier protein
MDANDPHVREILTRFVEEELGLEAGCYTLTTPLFSSGLLDSFALVALLSFAEQRFGIVARPEDLTPETVDSLDVFIRYIEATSPRDAH